MPEINTKKVKTEAEVGSEKVERGVIASIIIIIISSLFLGYQLMSGQAVPSDALFTIIELFIFIVLTYSLARSRSRVAAGTIFALYLIEQIAQFTINGFENFSIFQIILGVGLIEGILGANIYQKNKPAVSIPIKKWVTPTLAVLGTVLVILATIAIAGTETSPEQSMNTTTQSKINTTNELTAAQVYEKNSEAVFTIFTETGQGSGVMLAQEGILVTNYHVIEEITATSTEWVKDINGSQHRLVQVIASDPTSDLAIVKVTGDKHSFVEIGDSNVLSIGETVITIGSPEGFESTVSSGILSGRRDIEGDGIEELQISSPISEGSSGGALFNAKGELVGITSGGWSDGQNINFAIPTKYIYQLLQSYIESQKEETQ